ncbi:hypothetical protein TcasGA2_TC005416 [Tribolium castaneum]|uniref:Uncharacterized protein n=1 Tax=Tribolium castaneum TaxID=7070 RepID=D6WYY0_TRICA|nr:hypothetical protein TcasGA2_TC005416 [Tribolium castaneum]
MMEADSRRQRRDNNFDPVESIGKALKWEAMAKCNLKPDKQRQQTLKSARFH